MERNGLTRTDFGAELGVQPVVTAVLNGKRSDNTRQAKALAPRINVSAAPFL